MSAIGEVYSEVRPARYLSLLTVEEVVAAGFDSVAAGLLSVPDEEEEDDEEVSEAEDDEVSPLPDSDFGFGSVLWSSVLLPEEFFLA